MFNYPYLASVPPAKAPVLKPYPAEPVESPEVPGPVLALDIEVESGSSRFPDPEDREGGHVLCITVHLSCMDEIVIYATHDISDENRKSLGSDTMFILCSSEAEMLSRAVRFIGAVNPMYVYGDCRDDVHYLRDRARALKVNMVPPDLDRMFRMYDRKFNDIYGKSGMARKMDILQKCAESRHEFKQQLKGMR